VGLPGTGSSTRTPPRQIEASLSGDATNGSFNRDHARVRAAHLIALGVGLGSVWARARALGGSLDDGAVRRALAADTGWGIAALLWISTGLVRAFGGLEKGTQYYLQNHVFWTKMALLLAILVLEVWPMVTLIRWRIQIERGQRPDMSRAPAIARISVVQTVLVVLMVLAATAMARGVGGR
jgi:putative membrane protein